MSLISGFSVTGSSAADTGYQISRSLRFNSPDSAFLNRTPASAGNRKTWTWSGWVKRGSVTGTGREVLFGAWNADNDAGWLEFGFGGSGAGDTANCFYLTTATQKIDSTQVFRDPSAWYHFVVVLDTTQASNRLKVYVNSVDQQVSTPSSITLNFDAAVNNTYGHTLGKSPRTALSLYFPGYLTEINFIDGQALTPTSFGEFNSDTGVWQPIEYTGTYGTNGFYLNFSDNSGTTSTTLGKDSSGNGNNWTPNNFSVTAGAGNDSLVDSPTRYGTDTGAGGEVRGNYCTANPLNKSANTVITNGNLDVSSPSDGDDDRVSGTLGVSSGKWYFEATRTDALGLGNQVALGVMNTASALSTGQYSGNPTNSGATANEWALTDRGVACNNTTYTNLSSTIGTIDQNDVIQVCIDMDAKKIWFGIANTFSGSPSAGTGEAFSNLPDSVMPLMYTYDGAMSMNFGQRPFAYTAPSGFKALVTTNLPTPTIEDGGEYFNTVLYTGNGSTQSVTGVGFQPDFVWIKDRSAVTSHVLFDAIRGVQKYLVSNNTDAEGTLSTTLTAFNSDGFTYGTNGSGNALNDAYVAWNWKANGSGVSNTDGTITSTVSANTDSGFSIVTYTGTGANATVGHGLGVAPAMIIVKNRTSSTDWAVYHRSLTSAAYWLELNTTGAVSGPNSVVFNSTAPTSTVFSVGTNDRTNTNNHVAYCFAPVAGYSAFGSYTGNGNADGPMVYLGFRPRYVLLKVSSTTGDWQIFDTARNTYNIMNLRLDANASDAESTAANLDTVSNGFKLRTTSAAVNGSGNTIIYMAFAENPFSIALAR
jgi:hypothetical protein